MLDRSRKNKKKKPDDINQLAASIVKEATTEHTKDHSHPEDQNRKTIQKKNS